MEDKNPPRRNAPVRGRTLQAGPSAPPGDTSNAEPGPDLILAVLGGKGGPGKTTIATHLAADCVRRGKKVLLIDTDVGDQIDSAYRWTQAMKHMKLPAPVPMSMDSEDLPANLPGIAAQFDVVIIDGKPNLGPGTIAAMRVVDVVVAPFEDSTKSYWGFERTFALYQQVRNNYRPDLRLFAVHNKVDKRCDSQPLLDRIQALGAEILPQGIGVKKTYDRVFDVCEQDKANAGVDMKNFIDCLFEKITEAA